MGHSCTQNDIHNRYFKINSAMILTFVFVEGNAVTVDVKFNKLCVNMNKGCGYFVVYRSKKRHVYCKYEDDIRCDGTVVLYFLPLCSLIGKMNNQ